MLNRQQLQEFSDQGYLVLEDVFDQAGYLDPLRAEYEEKLHRICSEWAREGRLADAALNRMAGATFEECIKVVYEAGLDYFQPLDISLPPEKITVDTPMHAGDAVFRLMTCPALLDLVESVMGPEITSNPIQHVRIKPPASQLYDNEVRAHITATDWHQDRAVTLEEADRTRMLTVWIAINDATIENGCLQVIPRSHKSTMRPHCPHPQLAIPPNQFDPSAATPLPVRAGGAILFDPLTIHSSRRNETNGVRWSFDLRYNVTGDPTGRPMFPSFIARSRAHPETVLRDPAEWRRLWQSTQEHLISEPAVTIHRWSQDAAPCA